jgi:WD40 repeat protein
MAVSPDRRKIAITTGVTTRVFDARTREPLGQPIILPAEDVVGSDGESPAGAVVSCLVWTPDSSRLMLCNGEERVLQPTAALVTVDPTTGEEVRRSEPAVLDGVVLSPDGHTVAVSSRQKGGLWDGQVNIYDLDDFSVRGAVNFNETEEVFTDISFSPNGQRLALTGRSGELYLYDLGSGDTSRETIVSGEALLQAEWLPDSRTLAISSADGAVRLFDTARRQPRGPAISVAGDRRPAHVHLVPVTGDELVALSGERPGRRWSLDPDDWVERACAIAGRTLTRDEWAQYLPDRPYRPVC